ncbi:MAG: hypothetical protein KDA44_13175, partial [Planctomycetales bacterium]|nr:hypothetical protein [Planctomycetales bacterium]
SGACVAVLGSTAGVGATTVLIAAARELSSLGQRVLAIDGNLARPALCQRLGLSAAAGIGDVLAGHRRLCEATVPAPFGAALLGSVTTPPHIDPAARQRFAAELHAARERFDAVLIDLAAGLSPWSDWLCRRTANVLLVTTPRADDVRAAYTTVKSFGGEVPTRLAFNRTNDARVADAVARRIGETAWQFLGRNPLAEAPTLIPALGDDPLTQAEHRRACRLLAAELIVPSRLVHDRRAAHRSLPSHRAPSPASSTAASAVAAAPLDRLW